MEDLIRKILKESGTIAIVGLSDKPERDSHAIALMLQQSGYRIIPVNPTITETLGEKSYPDLKSIPGKIDIVNVFRRPDKVPPVIDEAIETGAGTIWLQTGISVDEAVAKKASDAGKTLIQNRCIGVAVKTLL